MRTSFHHQSEAQPPNGPLSRRPAPIPHLPQIPSAWPERPNWAMNAAMRDLLNLIRWMLLDLFRSRRSLEAEIFALRHQLNVLRRSAPKRPALSNLIV